MPRHREYGTLAGCDQSRGDALAPCPRLAGANLGIDRHAPEAGYRPSSSSQRLPCERCIGEPVHRVVQHAAGLGDAAERRRVGRLARLCASAGGFLLALLADSPRDPRIEIDDPALDIAVGVQRRVARRRADRRFQISAQPCRVGVAPASAINAPIARFNGP